jgi:hypothetical protein
LNTEIKKELSAKGYSHEYAALKIGISRVSLNKYLNGHIQMRADKFIMLIKLIDWDIRK